MGYARESLNEHRGVTGWLVARVARALLFNPIIPIHLNGAIWSVLNLAAAGLLIARMVSDGRPTGGDRTDRRMERQ